jgi:protein-disulfide isomerase
MALNIKTAALLGLTAITSAFMPVTGYALDEAQKKEFGAFIREYLIENPEIMLEVQTALEQKQDDKRNSLAANAVPANRDVIFNSPYDLTLGNPQGDVTLVEFFDYNCGYCKRAKTDIDELVKSDKNIRVILKEFPILGPDSTAAHAVSNAVRNVAPEKYAEFQRNLLGANQRADEDFAIEAATDLGIDEDALRASMKEKTQDASVKETYEVAVQLGIQGTPSYVIGNEAVFGAVGLPALKEKIANMRKCGEATCQ